MLIIKIEENNSLKVSKTFFDNLENKLDNINFDDLYGYYKTFNNCREQGLMLSIYNDDDIELSIWACECRNSDNIMVIVADSSCANQNGMFNDVAWKSAKYFKCDDYDSAVDYALNIITKQFKNNIPETINTKFKMYKSISFIKNIEKNISELDYNDYYELACFEDENEIYFCDLVVMDGKLGLRYLKYYDRINEEFDNLDFVEWQPDLTSSTTLMLGMQQKLNDFIEKEVNYNLEI